MEKKKITSIIFAIAVVAVAVMGVFFGVLGLIYFLNSSDAMGDQPSISIERNSGISQWIEYKNEEYGYKIKHPQEAIVEEVAAEGNIPKSCVRISYREGVVYIRSMDSSIPCGPAEFEEESERIYEPVKIGEKRYEASGYKASAHEFLMVNPNNINIIYGASAEGDKNMIKKIVGTFEAIDKAVIKY